MTKMWSNPPPTSLQNFNQNQPKIWQMRKFWKDFFFKKFKKWQTLENKLNPAPCTNIWQKTNIGQKFAESIYLEKKM